MSLASAGGGQGGRAGSDTHKASGGPWTAAGGVAGELRTSTQSAITKLDSSHEGLESGTAGFASTAALKGIRSGWKSRLEAVRDHFDKLAPNLAQAGKEFDAHEVKTEGTFAPAGRKSGK
ncbi:hypothetical protein [Streptomyces cinnamoneus]|nr:hypothetical protein [Streptomyces cinnamoneus]